MLEKLIFVTSNKGKAQEAQEILDFPIQIIHLELDEIQDMSLEKIIHKKAQAAYEIIKKPLIVDDVGFFVEAWNGFPGPFIKYVGKAGEELNNMVLKWISLEENKRVVVKAAIGFHDGNSVRVSQGEAWGTIVPPRGKKGWGFDPIFVPDGYTLTWAEMTSDVKNTISHRGRALEKLKMFLIENEYILD